MDQHEHLVYKISFVKNPTNYIISPPSTPQLAALRKRIKQEVTEIPKQVKLFSKDEHVAVFFQPKKVWERALVRDSFFSDGELKYKVFLVDRGTYRITGQVRHISDQLFYKLPFTAITVHLNQIEPVIPDISRHNSEIGWGEEANIWTCQLVKNKVELLVVDRLGNNEVLGDLILKDNGLSISTELCDRGWGLKRDKVAKVLNKVVLPSENESGNSSDSSCDSFMSAKSAFSDKWNDADNTLESQKSEISTKEEDSIKSESIINNSNLSINSLDSTQPLESSANKSFLSNSSVDSTQPSEGISSLQVEGKVHRKSITLTAWLRNRLAHKIAENKKFEASRTEAEGIHQSKPRYLDETFSSSVNKDSKIQSDGNDDSLEKIEKECCFESQYSAVLVRSNVGEVNPFSRFEDVPFSMYTLSAIRHFKWFRPYPIESYGFNAILDGKNTVMVASRGTGKTMAYVLPLMNSLEEMVSNNKIPEGNGPIGVIICNSSLTCNVVSEMCERYTNFNRSLGSFKTRIIAAHGGGAERSRYIQITDGCEVLVTTPLCFRRLLNLSLVLNLKRLQWLVLDDFNDLSSANFLPAVWSIVKKCDNLPDNRQLQWIITADQLSQSLWKLLTQIDTYALLIASHLEAAVYAKIKPSIVFSSEDQKLSSAVDAIMAAVNKHRIVVMCRKDDETIALKNALLARGCEPIVVHGGMYHFKQPREAYASWRTETFPVLLCTDDSLDFVRVFDATYLLHYSLPVKSKTAFGLRFSTLMANYRDHFNVGNSSNKDTKVIIYLDDENQFQLKHIVNFLERVGATVSEKVKSMCEEIERVLELQRVNLPLCHGLLSRGSCSGRCKSRHVLTVGDIATTPLVGDVSFIIGTINDGNCWGIRPISIIDSEGHRTMLPNKYLEIAIKLSEYFAHEDNWVSFGTNPAKGDLCAVHDNSKIFYRGRIECITAKNKLKQPDTVQVRLLDHGDLLSFRVFELWHLPTELASYPPEAYLMYISGISPCDFDPNWSPAAFKKAASARERSLTPNEEWRAKILVCLNGILFVENPIVDHRLDNVGTSIKDYDFVRDLIESGLAVKNAGHIAMVREKLGITADDRKTVVGKKEKPFKPQWAHFQDDLSSVIFTGAVGTDCIFVRLQKFDKLLQSLEDDCQKEVQKLQEKKAVARLEVGLPCLARDHFSSLWSRALVLRLDEDGAEVLFVDYADKQTVPLSDILNISRCLLTRLPFQAIECSLGGVKHISPSSSEVIDLLYNFCGDGDEQCLVQATRSSKQSTVTGGRLYTVNLMNSQGVSFGKQLADQNILERVKEEKSFLQDMDVAVTEAFDEDELFEEEEDVQVKEVAKDSIFKAGIAEETINTPAFEINENLLQAIEELSNDALLELWMSGCKEEVNEEGDKKDWERYKELFGGDEDCEDSNKKQKGNEKNKPMDTKEGKSENEIKEATCSNKLEVTKNELKHEEKAMNKVSDQPVSDEKPCKLIEMDYELIVPSGYIVPKILWQQDFDDIILRAQILHAKEDKTGVFITPWTVTMRCEDESGKKYLFSHRLFGSISPAPSKLKITPFHVQITLFKNISHIWPRLKKDVEKDKKISYEPDPFLGVYKAASSTTAGKKLDHIPAPESLENSSDEDSLNEEEFI